MFDASLAHAEETLQRTLESAISTPKSISVKCRVGVDESDTMEDLVALIGRLNKQNCKTFYLHARKAVLGGLLSPAQNRSVPPLNYPVSN
mmetsp:Transcript_13319/g.21464  ORF Transcript_13319/g.21464 Transcript_13319/m.21464 type:complete len:90 (+) Transcript_13319:2-271(+)